MSYPYTLERSVDPWGLRSADDEAEFEQRCRERASEALWEGVERNVDRLLPGHSSQWAVSTYLGECSREAQALLFQACHAACAAGDPINASERANRAAMLLRQFVEMVADEYGDDHWEQWK